MTFVGIFALALLTYLLTIYPSLAGGEAGALVAAACSLGGAQPVTHPLHTLAAHAFQWIPCGTLAWRVNLLSAVCDAGAAAVLGVIVARVTERRWAGVAAGLAFAWSPLVWTHAVDADVLALDNLLVALMLLAALRWHEEPAPRLFAACALFAGLALSNHPHSLLVSVPLFGWMVATDAQTRARRTLAFGAAAWLAGLVPIAWLVVAARRPAMQAWALDAYFEALPFGAGIASPAAGTFAAHLAAFAKSWAANLAGAGVVAVAAGVAAWRDSYGAVLVVSWLLQVLVIAATANPPAGDPLALAEVARLWQQPMLVTCAWLGVGLAGLNTLRTQKGRLYGPFLAVAIVSVMGSAVAASLDARNRSPSTYVDEYGRALLAPLPKDALLIVSGALPYNSIRYLQVCEGLRPDVIVLDQDLLARPWYTRRARGIWPEVMPDGETYSPGRAGHYDVATLIAHNEDARSVRIAPGFRADDESWKDRYQLLPDALALRVAPAATSATELVSTVAAALGLEPLRATEWPDPSWWLWGTWEQVVLSDYREAFARRGQWLVDHVNDAPSPYEGLKYAQSALAEASSLWEPTPWFIWKNLGVIEMRLADIEPSARKRAVAALRHYLETAPANEPDLRIVREWIAGAGPPAEPAPTGPNLPSGEEG